MWHFGTFQYHINIVDNFCKEKNCWKYQIVAEYFHKKYQKPLSWALTRAWWPSYLLPREEKFCLSLTLAAAKTQPWDPQRLLISPIFTICPTFQILLIALSWIFKFRLFSQKMSASRFLSPKVGEFMRLSRNIISIFVEFLPPGNGNGGRGERLYGNSTFLRKHRTISVTEGGLGVFVKKRCLVRSSALFSGSWILRQL